MIRFRRPRSFGDLALDSGGAQLVEYILIVGLVAIVCLAGFRAFGGALDAKVDQQAISVATLEPQSSGGDDGGGGGLFGSVTGWVGDRVDGATDWLGDRADDVGGAANWVQDSAWPFLRDYTPVGVHWGVVRGVGNTLRNLAYGVTHPIETLQGINYMLAHPGETLWAFGASSWAAIRENPAQGIGELGWSIGSFFIPGAGGTTTAVRVGTRAASTTTTATGFGDTGNDAARADVPGWVQTVDDVTVWTTPAGAAARFWEWAL